MFCFLILIIFSGPHKFTIIVNEAGGKKATETNSQSSIGQNISLYGESEMGLSQKAEI